MKLSKHWAKTYGFEGKEKFRCPKCGEMVGAVAGDTHIGTRYDNGTWDSRGWRFLKCGHGIRVDDYADGTRQITPAPEMTGN